MSIWFIQYSGFAGPQHVGGRRRPSRGSGTPLGDRSGSPTREVTGVAGAEEREREILDAAGRVFGKYGVQKTTVTDIVREAGISRATLYKHFAGKEEVFRSVLRREIADILSADREAVAEAETTREKLRAAIVTHTDMLREKINIYQVTMRVFADLMPRWRDHFELLVRETLEIYSGILREGHERGEIVVEDVRLTTWSLLLMLKGIFMGIVSGDVQEDRDEIVERMLDIIMEGLRPREETT
ncbi:MAG: TetR family transcriptional regulator [Candidatus Eisenbacteria bacterium]|nr:TetR family transcriptional regulator [Candidatus Eisenbacteria bacterium]